MKNLIDVLLRIDRRTPFGWAMLPTLLGIAAAITADGATLPTIAGGAMVGYGIFLLNCWDDDTQDIVFRVETGSETDRALADHLKGMRG